MKIQRLIYHGKREEGVINVRSLDVLSPWRKFKFYKGLNFQVGKVVPLDVADKLARDYPDHFRIETKDLDEEGAHKYNISDAVEECLAALGDEVTLKVVDEVVAEPPGGAHTDWDAAANLLRARLVANLDELGKLTPDELIHHRYIRFRRLGEFVDEG
jgi:hypothetical protein